MGGMAKFWSLSRREKRFLFEAVVLVLLSTACVKTMAFRRIERFLRTHWRDGIRGDIDREEEIRLVRHSLLRAGNAVPWKNRCLSRSIAEFIMLRRRGIPAVMCAGARFSGHSTLDAHAWVETALETEKSSDTFGFATVIRIGTRVVDR
jgi:hypothetical protein